MNVRDLGKSPSAYAAPSQEELTACDLCVSCISHLSPVLHLFSHTSDLNAKSSSAIKVYSIHGLLVEYKVLRCQSYHCCENITQENPHEVCYMLSAAFHTGALSQPLLFYVVSKPEFNHFYEMLPEVLATFISATS